MHDSCVLATSCRSVVKKKTPAKQGFSQAFGTRWKSEQVFGTEGLRFESSRVHFFSRDVFGCSPLGLTLIPVGKSAQSPQNSPMGADFTLEDFFTAPLLMQALPYEVSVEFSHHDHRVNSDAVSCGIGF